MVCFCMFYYLVGPQYITREDLTDDIASLFFPFVFSCKCTMHVCCEFYIIDGLYWRDRTFQCHFYMHHFHLAHICIVYNSVKYVHYSYNQVNSCSIL